MKFEHMVLTGHRIKSLMRKHRVTMRDIKAKHQIALKRIREVRESGVRGFFAAEWFWIITGRWPDEPAQHSQIAEGLPDRQQPASPRSASRGQPA